MLKVRKTDRKITPFGGINFVIDELEQAGIPSLIDNALPKRHGRSQYSYADCILSLVYGIFCGAERLEDFKALKGRLHNSSLNIPSPDVLGKIMKNHLAAPNLKITSTSGTQHDININPQLNRLLVDLAVELNTLNRAGMHTLDYDNTCLPCEKYDATYCYKGYRGYQPGVCWIGQVPVYVEGMSGNNPAAFDQINTLKRSLEILDEKQIRIKRFRADAASYQKEIIELMNSRGIEIYIRAIADSLLWDNINDVHHWRQIRIGNDHMEIASFKYYPFVDDKALLGTYFHKHAHRFNEYRIVVTRRPHKLGEINSNTGDAYVYRSIITNNWAMSDEEVLQTYNDRGDIERNFDYMNNDWNWSNLPFSFLSENTAFMIISAMGFTMYQYLIRVFSKRVDFVEQSDRVKAFRYNFISVAAEWEGDTLVIHDETRPWEQLTA